MSGRSVLVTGATGFIGRDLIGRLAAAGWQVRAAARAPWPLDGRHGIEAVAHGDLAGGIDWRPLVAGMSHVVHLAGIAHATASIPEAAYMAVNAEATRALAEAARAASVRRVVLVSSVRAQCGPTAAGVVTEERTPAPVDAYGRSKLAAERMLAEALDGSGTGWCVLRPVVLYGPGVKGNMAALARAARLPLPLPLGGLTARRSVLGLANLESAVVHALTSERIVRGTFLLADPGAPTVPEIAAAMRRALGRAPMVLKVPLAPARLAARLAGKAAAWERIAGELVVSTAALEATGWRPVETAAEGIARWMRDAGARDGSQTRGV